MYKSPQSVLHTSPPDTPRLAVMTDNDSQASRDDLNQYLNFAVESERSRSNSYNERPNLVLDTDSNSMKSVPGIIPDSPLSEESNKHASLVDKRYRLAVRVFFTISIVSALIVVAMQGYMFAVINLHDRKGTSSPKYVEVLIFLALFLFASVFQVFITYVGIKSKNMLLLLLLCAFYACMLIYTGIQYQEIPELIKEDITPNWERATRATSITTICIIAFTLLSQTILLFGYLKKDVDWISFKNIGADPKIKKLYKVFQIHRLLVIFSLFFFLAFTVQFIILMKNKTSTEFILTVCVLPLTIICLIVSDWAVAREILPLTVLCLIVYVCGLVYVLFKMIRLFTHYTYSNNLGMNVQPGHYFPGRNSLVTFGVITLVFLLLIVIIEVMLMMNFGKGLRPVLQGSYHFGKKEIKEEKDDEMSID